jgi:hypothetical protein
MNTSPSMDDMLAGVIVSLDQDILPELASPKAQATAAMMQQLLQSVRQMLPVYDQRLAEEHNAMTQTLRDTAEVLADTTGVAADRIRDRAAELGGLDDLAMPADRAAVMAAHRELGHGLESTMLDLDELQRAGESVADDALQVVRGHLGPRFVADVEMLIVGDGFVGRG